MRDPTPARAYYSDVLLDLVGVYKVICSPDKGSDDDEIWTGDSQSICKKIFLESHEMVMRC